MSIYDQPPMTWKLSGHQVMLWRTEAKFSREKLAEEAGYAPETVKSMEQGRRRPSQQLLEVTDQLCGAKGKLAATDQFLDPEASPSRGAEYMAFEAEAIAVHSYEALLIPGLLQTEEYARALLGGHCPPVDDETVEARVEFRMRRQELLRKQTTLFSFVIHEAALRSLVGGPEVMKRQLRHLVESAEPRNTSIQVLPMASGAVPGLNGAFTMLETAEYKLYGCHEAQGSTTVHADAETKSKLMKRYAAIRMSALGPADSIGFIQRLAEEL
ncbi:helix-turn-helix transcriptional regulator [Streptomyces sp. UNOC14_S4]|uniref:helix-turn-helix domain-containing protein n=1 Tax=Streptomyces sp. UNOC14_S4 TaxID=2872340 RepID=UPI001E4EBC21|nr:helix-turn-helix transcriptional regulator [Streptomyces sp. UNOC14_S4]MCC3769356.1 helix-turn-helix transcriptional regulator [Streptomyces sp. UNOC14_S4]